MSTFSRRRVLGGGTACALAPVLPLFGASAPLSTAHGATLEVRGTGASFPSRVYQKWAQAFSAETSIRVSYRPTGSGEGLRLISAREVDFGASDSPLTATQLAERRLIQVPTLVGGIVPVVRLPDLPAQRLILDGPVLADLFAGRIERWNDPRIAALNPQLGLRPIPVRRVVRADRSGTTDGFTRYLAPQSPAFDSLVGASQKPKWPGQVLEGEGNDGVVKLMGETEGAIGYVSFDRVAANGLAAVRLRNAEGNAQAASEDGFRSAIRASDLHRLGDDTASLLDRPGESTWPITLTSFVLVDREPPTSTRAEPTLRFLWWMFLRGDALTRGTGFAPLPLATQARVAARIASVRAQDGSAIRFIGG